MTFWDQHGQEVEISQADQKWLDDAYFTTQQMRLPVDSPRAALSYRVSTKGQVDHDDIPHAEDCLPEVRPGAWLACGTGKSREGNLGFQSFCQ